MQSVLPQEAVEILRTGRGVLIDVRERSEHAEARIPGARLVPLGELASRLRELPRDRTLIMQCHSGNRSRSAAAFLLESGFANVANLEGGILRWAREGRPLEP